MMLSPAGLIPNIHQDDAKCKRNFGCGYTRRGNAMAIDRVVAYIDGFNLYYGMRSKGWRRYYWLNVHLLVENLLKQDQMVMGVKYFTSRVSATARDPDKSRRQNAYLEALQTLKDVSIYYGHYLENTVKCFKCGAQWQVAEEKMTDVNIAVEMMVDAFQDRFDTALLISGDSDLTASVLNIRRLYPAKRIVAAFPPNRTSARLQQVTNAFFMISRRKLAASQFPDVVTKADGYKLARPGPWK